MKQLKQLLRESFLINIVYKYRMVRFKHYWKKRNTNNKTTVNCIFSPEIVTVGNNTYGELNIVSFRNVTRLFIGNFCSIGQNVNFILDAGHILNNISTYPFKTALLNYKNEEAISKGNIIIDDDVWIGFGATIMSGVHIGQGAVIAAGSVVTKDIPPYAVVGGVPAKVIKYRFPSDIIDELLKIDYNKMTEDMIKEHINELYNELESIEQLEWLPKK